MTPDELAQERLKISDEYGKLGEELCRIKEMKSELYPILRADCKSIAEADRMWEMSADGLKEYKIKMKMSSKEKKMSAIRTLLDVRNNEIYNQY